MGKFMRVGGCIGVLALAAACGAENTATQTETPASQTTPPAQTGTTVPAGPVVIDDLARHIETLSDDAFEGRAPATEGGAKTRAYLIDEMQKIGLAPGNGDSFEQMVPLVETTLDPARSSFSVNEQTLSYGDEAVFWTKRVEDAVSFADSDLVFVGYGVVAPEYGWNDYDGVDVRGKTVVILVNDPG